MLGSMMIYKKLKYILPFKRKHEYYEYTIKSDSSSISTGMDKHII